MERSVISLVLFNIIVNGMFSRVGRGLVSHYSQMMGLSGSEGGTSPICLIKFKVLWRK